MGTLRPGAVSQSSGFVVVSQGTPFETLQAQGGHSSGVNEESTSWERSLLHYIGYGVLMARQPGGGRNVVVDEAGMHRAKQAASYGLS